MNGRSYAQAPWIQDTPMPTPFPPERITVAEQLARAIEVAHQHVQTVAPRERDGVYGRVSVGDFAEDQQLRGIWESHLMNLLTTQREMFGGIKPQTEGE
jgi:hypothetical protein